MRSTRRLWLMFGGGVTVLAAVLIWVTLSVIRLEGAEVEARAGAAHQEQVRLALWRMDSWLTPLLAREAARPYFEYSSYYPQERAYTRMLQPLDSQEVLTASPLLSFASDIFTLHFQATADGTFSSPQVPQGRQLDLAVQTCIGPEAAQASDARLESLGSLVGYADLAAAVARSEGRLADLDAIPRLDDRGADPGSPDSETLRESGRAQTTSALPPAQFYEVQSTLNKLELSKRAKQARQATSNVLDDAQVIAPAGLPDPAAGQALADVGPLVPLWLDAGDGLLYVRQVSLGDARLVQGFSVDWPVLQEQLLAEVRDLMPEALLRPVDDERSDGEGRELATVPALLVTPVPAAAGLQGMSPLRWALVLGWIAAGLAAGAVGHTVRASLALSERRSRFVSSVTHELRTPLTTFRMYSEMLAEGMVSDEARRQEYLNTLRDESDRLSRLVENVLAYARLEEGRSPLKTERSTVAELLDDIRPTLERRASDGDMQLVVNPGEATGWGVETDPTAVGQVLFNLVDNAAKYAAAAADRRIELSAELRDQRLVLSVRDHGPGVQREAQRTVFEAFERRAPDAVPGVGLGLALSRALARELGGELSLDRSCVDGCRFEFSLPV
jgi:signal transduction histidine kinase